MVARDEPRRAGARAVLVDGLARGAFHGGMLRQIEIIVATERNQHPPVALGAHAVDAARLGEVAPDPVGLQASQFRLGKFIQCRHSSAPFGRKLARGANQLNA